MRRVHTLQLKYQCSVCSTRSEERRKLLNHEHSQHGLHTGPLPENNPAGLPACPCPGPGCRLVFGCGLAVKQHAWDAHQVGHSGQRGEGWLGEVENLTERRIGTGNYREEGLSGSGRGCWSG